MANDNLPNRQDRLKGPRPILTGEPSVNGAVNNDRAKALGPEGLIGPAQGSEEWRRLYETIRRAVEGHRS